ncbi:hypothetical protein WDU94_010672 [Cyamophila willieti]
MALSFVNIYILLILSSVSFSYGGGDGKCGLNDHDLNVVCFEAQKCNKFCGVQGAADDGCKKLADIVKGTEPSCFANNVCTFSKDGKPVYVASQKQEGATVFKDCKKGYAIIDKPAPGSPSPSPNSSPSKSGAIPSGSPTGTPPPSSDSSTATTSGSSGNGSPTSVSPSGVSPAGGSPAGSSPAGGSPSDSSTTGAAGSGDSTTPCDTTTAGSQ